MNILISESGGGGIQVVFKMTVNIPIFTSIFFRPICKFKKKCLVQ